MRGPPPPKQLLLLFILHCTQCTLQVRGETQPVMRMDRSAAGTFPYDPSYDGTLTHVNCNNEYFPNGLRFLLHHYLKCGVMNYASQW